MVFGETTVKRLPHRPAMIPVFVHLAIVLMLGLWIPPVPRRLVSPGGAADRMRPSHERLAARIAAAPLPCAMPAQRCPVSSGQLLTRLPARVGARRAARRLVGERRARPRARLLPCASLLRDGDGLTLLEHTLPDEGARYPDLSPIFPVGEPHAARGVRPGRRAVRRRRPAALDLAGGVADRPLSAAARFRGLADVGARAGGLSVRAGRRRRRARDRRSGPCTRASIEPGHFRFQVVGEKVLRLEERLGYAHKGIEKRFESLSLRRRLPAGRPRFRRQHRRLRLGLRAGGRSDRRRAPRRRARRGCARSAWSASASPTTWATWATSATTAASPSAWRSSRA